MTVNFSQFCERYELDPESPQAEAQWIESRRQLARLERGAERGVVYREEPSSDDDGCGFTPR